MRILLTKKEREKFFNFLKDKYKVNNFNDLSVKVRIPVKTLQKYRLGSLYMPENLIPKEFTNPEIYDKKPDNWGSIKGGKQGVEKKINHLKNLWHDPRFHQIRSNAGKKAVKNLIGKYNKEFIKKAIETKMKKRKDRSNKLEIENRQYFINKKILLNINQINFSKGDKQKGLKFPKQMSPELAEEIGVHLGDGCLSFNKKYFSVKISKKEKDYMTNFLFPLYKDLYNIDLRLMELESVVGFEIYSQALFDFKNKVLDIPYGNKIERIKVPKKIIESRNKKTYIGFIRGLFDTDGCVSFSKSKKNYPTVTFTIKSQHLIREVKEMLIKLGFIPSVGKWKIDLNGKLMVEKWLKEISSNNPKNLARLQQASSSTRIE